MRIRLTLKSFNQKLLNDYILKLYKEINQVNMNIQCTVSLPIKDDKFCVLKSPHIHKNSREQFELRYYKKVVDIDIETKDLTFLNFLNIKIPNGIYCEIIQINIFSESFDENPS